MLSGTVPLPRSLVSCSSSGSWTLLLVVSSVFLGAGLEPVPPACGAVSSSPCAWHCFRWCSSAPVRWAAPWLRPAAPPADVPPPLSSSPQSQRRPPVPGVLQAPGSPDPPEAGQVELGSHLKQTGSRKNRMVRWAGSAESIPRGMGTLV